jgi:hypothetical protein
MRPQVRRIVVINRIVLRHQLVDYIVRVAFEAVGVAAAAAKIRDWVFGPLFGEWVAVVDEECGSWNRVKEIDGERVSSRSCCRRQRSACRRGLRVDS